MKIGLSVQFWIWIIGGAISLVYGTSLASSYCEGGTLPIHGNFISNGNAIDAQKQPQEKQGRTDKVDNEGEINNRTLLPPLSTESGSQHDSNGEISNKSNSPASFWCDAKITDLGILFFTYCLAIVGFFTIRSNENTVRTLERAYLNVGPTKPILTANGVQVGISVHNAGRTAATIKRVFGQFSRTEPTGNVPTYSKDKKCIIDTDLALSAGATNDLGEIKFSDTYTGNQFFWGYVQYIDVFGGRRTARHCMAIFPGAALPLQIAGAEGWRADD